MASFLPLIDRCDNFRLSEHRNELALFCLSGDEKHLNAPVGLLWPEVVSALKDDNRVAFSEGREQFWTFIVEGSDRDSSSLSTAQPDPGKRVTHVHFAPPYSSRQSRSSVLATTCSRWHTSGLFAEAIGGRLWRDELYPIYEDPFRGQTPERIACEVERAAAALFGIVTYGVHMTIYQRPVTDGEGEMMVWVATRAKTKQTYVRHSHFLNFLPRADNWVWGAYNIRWPGFLDNSVAGGIPAGMSAFESLVKESMEEASIAGDIVRKHARVAGCISYFFQYVKRTPFFATLPDTFYPKKREMAPARGRVCLRSSESSTSIAAVD
jgi:hypothetical protein